MTLNDASDGGGLRQKLPLFFSGLVIIALVVLDIRDLHFKIGWLGPYDSQSFQRIESNRVLNSLLIPTNNLTLSAGEIRRDSGWSSYLSTCAELYGQSTASAPVNKLMDTLLGKNCSLEGWDDRTLVLSGSLRVDAVAWASCKLLYYNQRPPICQEAMVTGFLKRYHMEDIPVPLSALSPMNSEAEGELIRLLNLISASSPTYQVVCVEAIDVSQSTDQASTLFGCASPNLFASAFAGIHAGFLSNLLQDKTWLTVDVLNVMGLRLSIRQNSKASFRVSTAGNGDISVSRKEGLNISASGFLYNVMVVADVYLLIIHFLASWEIITVVIRPLLYGEESLALQNFSSESLLSFWPRMLYRSGPIIVLTYLTRFILWYLILPSTCIWSESTGGDGKVQAFLTMFRMWPVILIGLNMMWSGMALISERRAFSIVKKTYLTTFELLVIVGIITWCHVSMLEDVRGNKYRAERQRILDTTSFSDFSLVSNSYDEYQDGLLTTSSLVFQIVYGPIISIFGLGIFAIICFLPVKMVVLKRFQWRQDLQSNAIAASREYERLPLEELMGMAIRARSLVRTSFDLELVRNNDFAARVSNYMDFGVILVDGCIRTRYGFLNILPPKVDVSAHFAPDGGSAEKKDLHHFHADDAKQDNRRPSTLSGSLSTVEPPKRRKSLHVPLR